MPIRRTTRRQTLARILAVLLCLGLAWGGWLILRPTPQHRVVIVPQLQNAQPVMFGSIQLKPVDMPVALLFDCYENALENVPPRTDTSKRQWSWEAPPLPMDVARREIGKPGANEGDKKVLAWLEDWEGAWKKDYPTTTDQLWKLEPELRETKVPFQSLFEIGLAMSFLDDDENAVAWFEAALDRATRESANLESNNPGCAHYLSRTAQMRSLWVRRNYRTLLQRFAIESRLLPHLTKQSRQAGHLLAEMDYYQGNRAQAAGIIDKVDHENDLAGDLTAEDKSEAAWTHGLLLFGAARNSEALPLLKFVVDHPYSGFPHLSQATKVMTVCLARMGHADEAQGYLQRWIEMANPDIAERLEVMSEIESARTKSDF